VDVDRLPSRPQLTEVACRVERGCCQPRSSQTRTSIAHGSEPMNDFGCWQEMLGEHVPDAETAVCYSGCAT